MPTEPAPVPSAEQFHVLCKDSKTSIRDVSNCCTAFIAKLSDDIDTAEVNHLINIAGELAKDNKPDFAKEILSQLNQTNTLSAEQRSYVDDCLNALPNEVVISDQTFQPPQQPSIVISMSDDSDAPPRPVCDLAVGIGPFDSKEPLLISLLKSFGDLQMHCKNSDSPKEVIDQKCKELLTKMSKKDSGATPELFCALLELGIELKQNAEKKEFAQCIFSNMKDVVGSIPPELRYEVRFRFNCFGQKPTPSNLSTLEKFAIVNNRPMAAYDCWKTSQGLGINPSYFLWAIEKAAKGGYAPAQEELLAINAVNKNNLAPQALSNNLLSASLDSTVIRSSASTVSNSPQCNTEESQKLDRSSSTSSTSSPPPIILIQKNNNRPRNVFSTASERGRYLPHPNLDVTSPLRNRAKSEGSNDNKDATSDQHSLHQANLDFVSPASHQRSAITSEFKERISSTSTESHDGPINKHKSEEKPAIRKLPKTPSESNTNPNIVFNSNKEHFDVHLAIPTEHSEPAVNQPPPEEKPPLPLRKPIENKVPARRELPKIPTGLTPVSPTNSNPVFYMDEKK